MKILFLHNYYRYRGGEDLSFESEVAMLRKSRHEVVTMTRHNDQRTGISGAIGMARDSFYNSAARREVATMIAEHRPDVMHCNNLFPQFSPSVYGAAREQGVAVVQALRNYRAFCVNSLFYRDGKVCTECLGRSIAIPGVLHKCYRNSHFASAMVATMQRAHKAMNARDTAIDLFFTPSEFARQIYIRGGFDPDRIVVKPNFVENDHGPGDGLGDDQGEYALFIGRLSAEKGLHVLLAAWERLNKQSHPTESWKCPRLKIVGDGPLAEEVRLMTKRIPNIESLGQKSHHEILELLGGAKFLVMPSVWYETFGRTIIEAFSRGTPAVVSSTGSMAELVRDGQTGMTFITGDDEDLSLKIRELMSYPPDRLRDMRLKAHEEYLARYTSQANEPKLMQIYETAIARGRR